MSYVLIEPLLKLPLLRFRDYLFYFLSILWDESNLPNCISCWVEIIESLSFWVFWLIRRLEWLSIIPDTLFYRFSIFLCITSMSFYFPFFTIFVYLIYLDYFKSDVYLWWSNERWKLLLSIVLLALIRDFFTIWGTGSISFYFYLYSNYYVLKFLSIFFY